MDMIDWAENEVKIACEKNILVLKKENSIMVAHAIRVH